MDALAPDGAAASLTSSERWRSFAACLLGWLFDFYDLVLFAYLAAAIGRDWHWGGAFAHNKGLLVGAALAASGVGGVLFGGLSDRYGRRRVMAWTILVYSLGTGLCSCAWGLWSLAFFRILTGLGVGGEWATGHALMAEIFPSQRRGIAAAMLQAGEPIGVGLAVLAGLCLEPVLGWRAVFLISALPAVLVLFLRRMVRESPLWVKSQQSLAAKDLWAPYRTLLRDHWKRALQGWVLGASKMGTYWLTYVWLPEYFSEIESAARVAGPAVSSFKILFILTAQASQFVGMLLFGAFSDRVGRRPAFTLYSLLTAAGLFVLTRHGVALLAHPVWFWLIMVAVGLGSGCTAGFGALLAELFPTSIRNTAMGAVYNLSRAFQFVTQFVMAVVVMRVGVAHGLLMAVALALLTSVWVWTFPETRGIALRED